MSIPLLLTKFHIPTPGARIVHRHQLIHLLEEGRENNVSLILVCGPAGYGKTTLVSDWVQACQQAHPRQFAWLTLESGDDDLTRFVTYFIHALQRIHPGFGDGVLKMLQTHKPQSPAVLATLLVNQLSELTGRVFLILDDFHLLTAQPIQDFMSFLVDHQPSQMCLVLLTRTDPPLPLARLRARGQLLELRQSALCFSLDEAGEFTNRSMELGLTPDQVAFLAKQTEGWISGLQLAAISLRQEQERSDFFEAFSGEHAFIADYLAEEVLGRLPETVRTFLLQTSILERLTAPLCEAVTGQHGAREMLHLLLDSNMFILPLDERHAWYRYHRLFADLLRKRLQEVQGVEVPDLHRRASRWFIAHDMRDLAIEHAIAGEDYEEAARLLEQVAENMLMYGQAVTLLRWLDVLPQEILLSRPALLLLKAFALFLCGQSPAQAGALIQELSESGAGADYQGELLTIQAMLAILRGQPGETIRLSAEAMRQLPAQRVFFRSLAADSLGMGRTLAGDYPGAMEAFEQVVEISQQSDNVMMTLMALSNLAGLRYMQGQLRAAIRTCQQVVELATQRIDRGTPMLGKALFNLGEMLREQGDLDGAQVYLLESAGMMERFSEIGLSLAYLAIGRLYTLRQDWSAAQAYLDKARQRAQVSHMTWIDDRLVDVAQARYWITRGELEQVVEWARQRDLLDRAPAEIFLQAERSASVRELLQGETLMLARLYLARHQAEKALEMLSFLQEQAEQRGQLRRVIEVLALKALALQAMGNTDLALQTIGKALALAAPEGYQSAFVDEGEPMARLLYQASAQGISPGYAGKLLATLSRDVQTPAPSSTSSAADLVEPLSARELEVLQLIAEGLSNNEIANRLYISLSTVKGHTSHIYGKLGVKNRSQAVAYAHSLGLIKPD